MNKEEIKKFIYSEAQKRISMLGIEHISINDDTDLVKEGIFDSLSFVDLIAAGEEKFNVQVDLEKYEAGEFSRIKKLIQIISESKITG